MTLKEFFQINPKVALAFSGGVDSAYLLYAAVKYGADVKAYFVKSAFQPDFELNDARKLIDDIAEMFEIDDEKKKNLMEVIPCDILESDVVTSNPSDRCYHCKQRIFGNILKAAAEDGFSVIIDGTNASDAEGDRPGMKALMEMEVKSPLRLCGLKKSEIRELSKEAGLFTWNKPSYACLATRIPTGIKITADDIERVEIAEGRLEAMGFTDFRVRLMYSGAASGAASDAEASQLPIARIQLKEEQMEKIISCRKEILVQLKDLFSGIVLDMEER